MKSQDIKKERRENTTDLQISQRKSIGCDFVYPDTPRVNRWGLSRWEGEGDLFRGRSHPHTEFVKDLKGPFGLSMQRLLSSFSCLITMPP